MVTPFRIHIDPAVIADLRTRLSHTRWPDELANDDWNLGTNEAYLQQLCAYWQHDFDWAKQEAQLNTFPQFKATVDGEELHFIYQKGAGTHNVPILLTHGWPDSIVRFIKIIPLLTAPDADGNAFDVLVPSIPGYGFSAIPTKKGMNPRRIADLFDELMTDVLDYDTYYAHGGDWGSSITEQLALYHADSLLGIHLTDVPFAHGMQPIDDPSAAETKFLAEMKKWNQTEGAYTMIQATKPQTLAYGLNDSPAGLAAWIIEKFYAWSDNDGDLEDAFTKDELLTNITFYWATQTINSSVRLYYEAIQAIMQAMYNPLVKYNPFDKTGNKTKVPTAFALFPEDISQAPREFAERFFNVQRWTEMSAGGHFAALEQPKKLASDIRDFARQLAMFK